MSVVLNKEWVVNVIQLELLCEALCNNIYFSSIPMTFPQNPQKPSLEVGMFCCLTTLEFHNSREMYVF
jgi:hypothetical protein